MVLVYEKQVAPFYLFFFADTDIKSTALLESVCCFRGIGGHKLDIYTIVSRFGLHFSWLLMTRILDIFFIYKDCFEHFELLANIENSKE